MRTAAETAALAEQQGIEVGDIVRSYDFPGHRDDCYVEGVVTEINRARQDICAAGTLVIHVLRDVALGVERQVGDRLTVHAPLGLSSLTRKPAVVLVAKRVKEEGAG